MKEPDYKIDSDGYPTDGYLDWIKNYDTMKESGFDLLMDVVCHWWMEYGVKVQRLYRGERKVYLSTGGWSGNEDIMGALRGNTLFWMQFYFSHQTGGHYVFRFKKK